MQQQILSFQSDNVQLEGVLRYPDQLKTPTPGVLLINGSMEHDRDGNVVETFHNKKVVKKNFFLEISRRFCENGFATFSWDKRGFGKSQGPQGNYFTEVDDAKSALNAFCQKTDIVDSNRIAVFGQSAGVFVACLMAAVEKRPKAFILSGGLFSEYKDMMSFNYHRVRDYALRSLEHLKWAEKNDLGGLMLGINLDAMFQAVDAGATSFHMEYKGTQQDMRLNPKDYMPQYAPKNHFRYIQQPTLVIHGDCDLNVPVGDASKVCNELHRYGNNQTELIIIPGADHSFQQAAEDEDTRLQERMSLDSFRRPYVESYFQSMINFLKRRFPDA